ncbi:MAG: ABC-F family ATP-binding cassette domain-containing protein [Clostridia bacterium]|nr:ABC-F family ATP-binding cassette domain-containing protein [Clostridia bacterium]
MIILDVNKLSKNFGYGELFENLSFSLNEGESISIVGPNGCGKSTLLKMIAGIERIEKGTINIKKGAKVAYLDQTGSSIDDDRCVYEILKSVFNELNEMEARLNKLQDLLSSDLPEDKYNDVMIKYCNLMEKFSNEGGYDVDVNIKTVVEGLKIDKNILNQNYNNLSGGEKTLVQLAKALLIKPDLFLLDEPTNHLDINRIEWLESYIKSFKGATVIVSHDRYFLDKMSNQILALDNGISKIYKTNYSGYIIEKQRDFEKQMAEYKDQQTAMKRLEEQIKYFSERGMATNSSTLCDRAHSLQTQLDRMKKNAVTKPKEQKKLLVGFDEERKTSKRVISAEKLTISIPNDKTILNNINLSIFSGERVALIGANGSGKSTFIKAVMGTQELPISGEIFIGPSVKIGYLPQIISFKNDKQQLLDYFKEEVCIDEQKARKILANFQFYKEDVTKKVKNLSGGEKIRVKLAELLQQKINTLIFDEPTNHIDIPTKEVLEEAISNFEGTLIFISHDRYFINKFADRTVEFIDGNVRIFLGGYDDYKNEKRKIETITSQVFNKKNSKK